MSSAIMKSTFGRDGSPEDDKKDNYVIITW